MHISLSKALPPLAGKHGHDRVTAREFSAQMSSVHPIPWPQNLQKALDVEQAPEKMLTKLYTIIDFVISDLQTSFQNSCHLVLNLSG